MNSVDIIDLAGDKIEGMRIALAVCYHQAGLIIGETAGAELDCAVSAYLVAGTIRRTIENLQDNRLQQLLKEGVS